MLVVQTLNDPALTTRDPLSGAHVYRDARYTLLRLFGRVADGGAADPRELSRLLAPQVFTNAHLVAKHDSRMP